MPRVTNRYSVMIKAQPDSVFNYVADLTQHPEWSGGRLRIEALSPGPVAVGSRYRSHGDVAGQKDRPNQLRVTHYQPSSSFVFVAQDPDFGEVTHEFTFNPADGGTLMERAVSMDMSPLTAIMFKFVVRPLIGKPMMDKSLAALRSKLEQRAT